MAHEFPKSHFSSIRFVYNKQFQAGSHLLSNLFHLLMLNTIIISYLNPIITVFVHIFVGWIPHYNDILFFLCSPNFSILDRINIFLFFYVLHIFFYVKHQSFPPFSHLFPTFFQCQAGAEVPNGSARKAPAMSTGSKVSPGKRKETLKAKAASFPRAKIRRYPAWPGIFWRRERYIYRCVCVDIDWS